MDRRIEKTKEKLKGGLLSLLDEKPLEHISVSALCERAGIDRSTFYFHYVNISELFDELFMDAFREMVDRMRKTRPVTPDLFLRYYFMTAYRQRIVFREIHRMPRNNPYIRRIFESFQTYGLVNDLYSEYDSYVITYHLSGFHGVVSDWLESGCRKSPDEMAELVTNLYSK